MRKRPKLLISRSNIRRAGVSRLREMLAEMQAESDRQRGRQEVYDTYVAISDEIARRKADPAYVPLLIKKSSVYGMSAAQITFMLADLRGRFPTTGEEAREIANTIELLEGERERRRRHDKHWYWKRKLEDACSTPLLPHSLRRAPSTSNSVT